MSYISQHSGATIDGVISDARSFIDNYTPPPTKQEILLEAYPVGSLFLSLDSASPASKFGGTWEKIQNKFLLASGDAAAGSTGGSATHTHTSAAHSHTTQGHTLTIAEMPAHTHTYTDRPKTYKERDTSKNNIILTNEQHSTNEITYSTASAGGGASHSHGNTGSTTPGATGSASNSPPYISINVWKRTS